MRARFLLFLLFVLQASLAGAQVGDCNGAIVVCNDLYEETDAPVGTGSVWEVAPGSCQTSGEFNSVWYTFTVQESGVLNFVLTPNNLNDDYDWSLFNITDNGCAGISSGNSPEVSCNSWGTIIPPNGTTGISTDLGGVGSSNGPGDLLGPPFNEDIGVVAGETYALVVMNWSGSTEGYSLDFGLAEASIFDDLPPEVLSVVPNCSGEELVITFSEDVLISSVEPGDFTITGPGGSFAVTAVDNDAGAAADYTDEFVLEVAGGIAPEGDYTLEVLDVMNYVEDACGNVFSGAMDFFVSDPLSFEYTVIPACNGEGGEVELFNVQGGTPPLEFTFDGGVEPDYVVDLLTPGFYAMSIEDATGCSVSQVVEVENFDLSVDAGEDLVPCAMEVQLTGATTGGTTTWTGPAEVLFDDAVSTTTLAEASEPGTYALVLTAQLGTCTDDDVVNVSFSYPLAPDVAEMDASCFEFCDGSVSISDPGNVLTVTMGEQMMVSDSAVFDNLCAGDYNWMVVDAAGCNLDGTVSIAQPPAVVANFIATPPSATVTNPYVEFENTSLSDTASWWSIGNPPFYETDSVSFGIEFPPVSGTYEVTLLVTDAYGCTDEVVQTIVVADNFMVFVPNAFSPNQDLINDVFLPHYSYIPEEFQIFVLDRWGTIVFASSNPEEAWTGEVRNGTHYAQDGVYQWIIEAKGHDPDAIRLEGFVVVIR
ncbi:MAG: gliding motility-associated C-terminal domain-containing protein [Flavobacteriales bacterium]|nr:gliding motility-associated C-terminal domain-containing protein [Flavobacteriales bacterium]